jgi:hypothetical protein
MSRPGWKRTRASQLRGRSLLFKAVLIIRGVNEVSLFHARLS